MAPAGNELKIKGSFSPGDGGSALLHRLKPVAGVGPLLLTSLKGSYEKKGCISLLFSLLLTGYSGLIRSCRLRKEEIL